MKVRTNADTPHDAKVAREFGAEGIGLCRTEHMFFEAERIAAVREMILSEELEGREKALAKILPMQKGDFIGIFREMKGLPVTIRLLDPPLHEFLPQEEKDIEDLARTMKVTVNSVKHKIELLHEFNPMLGHRGCRLGITYPEIYDMQVRAIMEAACELVKNEGFSIVPEIMIPLIATVSELQVLKQNAVAICEEVIAQYGVKVEYLIGTMIELPRAALTADEIADEAEFFSFGTNDLTQTTFGLSRDDAGKFLPFYVENGILPEDPFVSLDQDGVGELVKMACELGRATRPGIKLGICGEHGGDPASVDLLPQHRAGLRLLLALPGADRPPGRCPRRAGLIRIHDGMTIDPRRRSIFPSIWHEKPPSIEGGEPDPSHGSENAPTFGRVCDFDAELFFPEHQCAEDIDLALLLPGILRQAGLEAGMPQEGLPVPAVFRGHLRQQHTAGAVLYQVDAVLSPPVISSTDEIRCSGERTEISSSNASRSCCFMG